VEPNAEALAAVMEWMWTHREKNREMQHEAHATISRLGIEWPQVLERLVA